MRSVGAFFALVFILSVSARAQSFQFQRTSESVGLDMVANFVENREKFSNFACKGVALNEFVNAKDDISSRNIDFIVFENSGKRLARSTFKIFDMTNGEETGWLDVFSSKGKQSLVVGKVEMEDDYSKAMLQRDWLPKDPWSWSIISGAGIEENMEDALLWMTIFQEKKLLAVEEDGVITRAEWDVGPLARVQVHFDRRKGNMPIFCRYVVPVDKEKHFSSKSKILFNEVETDWAPHLKGWVPIKVKNYREGLDAKNKVTSSETWQFTIDWNSRLLVDGVVDEKVFEKGKLKIVQLSESFSKGTKPSND